MFWRCDTWHLPLPAARTALARLVAMGFAETTVASRPGGGGELTLWGRGGRIAPEARMVLIQAGARRVGSDLHDEAVLLAAYAADAPVELAPGVRVVTTADAPRRRGLTLVIPPAPAFGDGRHPSTRIAARRMMALPLRGRRVLDLGCGTGVLGLLAWRRGADRVDFADLDPGSIRATRAACRLNGLDRPRIWRSDLLAGVRGSGYDLVIANLYADLCLPLLADPRLTALLPTGTLLLSGVAHRRRAAVERALRSAGFAVVYREQEARWWSLVATRPALSARRPARSQPGTRSRARRPETAR